MFLVVIHPDNSDYQIVQLDEMEKEIKSMIAERAKELGLVDHVVTYRKDIKG